MRAVAVLFALTLVPACTTSARMPGRDTGTVVHPGEDSGSVVDPFHDANFPDGGMHGSSDCSDAAHWIYLVDQGNAFLRYQPDSGTLTQIGTIHCAGALVTPFSMAVSRDATAYVLHTDHHIYAVSTADASCTPTTFTINQMGFQAFGMGFVSDTAGGTSETLFIAGGAATGIGGGSSTLGSVQIADWSVSTIGPLSGSPELTGNGLGQLWGFFPDTTPMAVRQIDRTDGATIDQYDVSAIRTGSGAASAWAFAYWGGRYYMFYQQGLGGSTSIFTLTPDTLEVVPVMTNIGYSIVGAGVSTCAPTILI
jgi:hypothetical protein